MRLMDLYNSVFCPDIFLHLSRCQIRDAGYAPTDPLLLFRWWPAVHVSSMLDQPSTTQQTLASTRRRLVLNHHQPSSRKSLGSLIVHIGYDEYQTYRVSIAPMVGSHIRRFWSVRNAVRLLQSWAHIWAAWSCVRSRGRPGGFVWNTITVYIHFETTTGAASVHPFPVHSRFVW